MLCSTQFSVPSFHQAKTYAEKGQTLSEATEVGAAGARCDSGSNRGAGAGEKRGEFGLQGQGTPVLPTRPDDKDQLMTHYNSTKQCDIDVNTIKLTTS